MPVPKVKRDLWHEGGSIPVKKKGFNGRLQFINDDSKDDALRAYEGTTKKTKPLNWATMHYGQIHYSA